MDYGLGYIISGVRLHNGLGISWVSGSNWDSLRAVYTSLGVMNLWTLIVARRKLPDLSSIYDNQADGVIPPIGYARPLIYAFIAISITAIVSLGPSLLGWW